PTPTTQLYTLSLHDALPISRGLALTDEGKALQPVLSRSLDEIATQVERLTGSSRAVLSIGVVGTFAVGWLLPRLAAFQAAHPGIDRKSTRLNSSHVAISYAV